MRRRWSARAGLLVGVALAVVAILGLAAFGRSPHPRTSAGQASVRTLSITCRSPSLDGTLPTQVYLPPHYSAHSGRYRAIYFLHGLPATRQSYTQNAFVAQALVRAGRRAIVVAPQGAREDDSDREYLDWSPTENWPRAISVDLTNCIDRRFHTLRDRMGRALVGLSAGGYGAFNVGLRNLATFAAVESWSGYFAATDPSGYRVLQFGSAAAQRAATVPTGAALTGSLKRWPSLVAFYVGNADDRFADTNQVFDAALRRSGIAHLFRIYPGGHSAALWRSEAPSWLTMALRYLATGRMMLR